MRPLPPACTALDCHSLALAACNSPTARCLRGVRYLARHVTAGRALSGSDERSCSALHACEFARFGAPRATLAHASPPCWCRASCLHLETGELDNYPQHAFLGPFRSTIQVAPHLPRSAFHVLLRSMRLQDRMERLLGYVSPLLCGVHERLSLAAPFFFRAKIKLSMCATDGALRRAPSLPTLATPRASFNRTATHNDLTDGVARTVLIRTVRGRW
jgi:hypothetical protein